MSQYYDTGEPSTPRRDRLEYLEEEDLERLKAAVHKGGRVTLISMGFQFLILAGAIVCAIQFPDYRKESLIAAGILALSIVVHFVAYQALVENRLWGPQIVALLHAILALAAIVSIVLVARVHYAHPKELIVGILPGCLILPISVWITRFTYTAATAIPALLRNPLWIAEETRRATWPANVR